GPQPALGPVLVRCRRDAGRRPPLTVALPLVVVRGYVVAAPGGRDRWATGLRRGSDRPDARRGPSAAAVLRLARPARPVRAAGRRARGGGPRRGRGGHRRRVRLAGDRAVGARRRRRDGGVPFDLRAVPRRRGPSPVTRDDRGGGPARQSRGSIGVVANGTGRSQPRRRAARDVAG